MVYLLVVLVVVFVTPYETDYPATVLSVGCLMLLVGGARLTAGKRLSASPVETLFRWKGSFRLLVFSQFLLWGLFCALTVGLYGTDWTAMLVLFCSSALAGGGISSLAPDYKLGARCLLAIMLPTSIVAAAQGTTETYTITFLTGLYLAFLLLQARQHEHSYWATSVAAALEATRESDKLFRAAFENAGIGMALIGTAGQFLRVNGALCEMFARSEKELLAADLPSLSHADDSYTSRGMLQRLTQGESRVHFEQRYVQKQGTVVWGSVSMSAVGSMQEEQRYCVMMVQDISERKQAEEEQRKLATLVENSSDFVGLASFEGKVLYLNPAGRKMVGVNSSAELEYKTIDDFHPEAVNAEIKGAIWPTVLKTGSWEGELQLRHIKTGDPIAVEARMFTVKDPSDGGILCFASVMRDLRQQKRLEEDLRRAQKLEAVGVLAGGIAHELNNILAAIIMFSELAMTRLPEGTQAEKMLQRVLEAGARGTAVVEQVLAFGRREKPDLKVIPAESFVQEAVEFLRGISTTNGGDRVRRILRHKRDPPLSPDDSTYDVQRPAFGLFVDSAEIFTNQAQKQHLHAGEKHNEEDQRGEARG